MTRRQDDGFTLIELLVAMALGGLVIGIVGTAFVVSLGTTTDVEQQLLESQASGLSSAIVSQDVASATTLSVGSATCSTQAGTAVLTLGWTDVSTAVVVDYRFDSTTGTLTRYAWSGTGCGSTPESVAYGTSLTSAVATAASLGTKQGATLVLTGRLGTSQSITAFRRV